jgi:putative transposase
VKRSRFTEEQIIQILREQESGVAVMDLFRQHGLSSLTFYTWKAKFCGLDVFEARRLKALEDENAKLKRMLADATLDNVALKEKMMTPAGHREAAGYLRSTYEMSQRPAGLVITTDRSSVRYQASRPDVVFTAVGRASLESSISHKTRASLLKVKSRLSGKLYR